MGNIDRIRQGSLNLQPNMNKITTTVNRSYASLHEVLVNRLYGAGINVSQREINRAVLIQMQELRKDLENVVYDSIEDAYKQGQAQNYYALYEEITVKEAKEFLGGTVPTNWQNNAPTANYLKQHPKVFQDIAEAKLTKRGLTLAKAKQIVVTEAVSDRYIRNLFADTYGDILLATNNTESAIKKVVREVVSDITQYEGLLDRNSTAMAKEIRKRLTKKGLSERIVKDGFVGITDKAGRRWDLGTYSKMVSKTKVEQAFREGERQLGEELGLDLAVISSHGAEDACRNWEGVVVSMNGKTEGYPKYEDVVATNEVFHPNCEHHLHTIRSLDMLAASDADRHRSKVGKVSNPEKRKYKRKGES